MYNIKPFPLRAHIYTNKFIHTNTNTKKNPLKVFVFKAKSLDTLNFNNKF